MGMNYLIDTNILIYYFNGLINDDGLFGSCDFYLHNRTWLYAGYDDFTKPKTNINVEGETKI